jgi:ankyrin repeat protein
MDKEELDTLLRDAFIDDDSEKLAKVLEVDPSLDLQKTLEDAAKWNNIDLMKFLVSKGADMKANDQRIFHDNIARLSNISRDAKGMFDGEIKSMEFIISQGIDINAYNGHALILCSRSANLDLVKLLVSHGADLKANDQEVLHKSLSKFSAYDKYNESSFEEEILTIDYMLGQGVDINGQNGEALSICAGNGALPIVKHLIEKGANVTANNNFAVAHSANEDHLETTLYLLSKGADKKVAIENATPDVEAGIKRHEIYEKIRNATTKIKSAFSAKHISK